MSFVAFAVCFAAASLCSSVAQADTFSYTGGEQTYTVPAGVGSVRITAIGAAGGSPPAGGGVPGGRGAVVTGLVPVSPGQILYVYVGGTGGMPEGGFNGGGAGGTRPDSVSWGGGGASDVSTVPDSAGDASLQSRLIVAAGGGGSAGIAAGGGDAGASGGCCGAAGTGPSAAQPGSQTAGGVGGGACATPIEGCGGSGSLGAGGDGGASGTGGSAHSGGGGGGGLYGGGGGAGLLNDASGGAGGSSLVPAGGSAVLTQATTTPARIDIEPYTLPPARRCANGVDDDGDGLTDFPADRGCSDATDDDEAGGVPLDTVAPAAKLTGHGTQKLGRAVALTVTCGSAEDCLVSATGTLSIPGAARLYTLRPAKRRTVARGTQTALKLRVPAKAAGAARRALRRHKKLRANVTVTVADAAGNTTTLKRTVRLVLRR